MKKYLLSVVGVLVACVAVDFVVHGILLHQAYMDTASLWRPEAEMSIPLIHLGTLISVMCFVWIYDRLVTAKSCNTATKYGLVWGIAVGCGMSICTYAVMPIPMSMAMTWLAGALVEWTIGGAIMGWAYSCTDSKQG